MSTSIANSLSDFSRDLVLRDGAMLRFRALRPGDRDAATMIRETRAHRLLQGFRGSAPADAAALERLLLALGALAEAAPRIAEVDLNPVIVHQEGAGVSLIDARVRLSE
jgi:acyl-CoA synthetase (NDP forming)